MRVHSLAVLSGILCLFAAVAAADITRLSPTEIAFGSEDFLTIHGTALTGTVATEVVFDGQHTFEPVLATSTELVVWIPTLVAITPGQHSLLVRSIDAAGVRTHGPVTFVVRMPDSQAGPPVLFVPELIIVEAESARGAVVNFEATATDGVNALPVTCTPPSGSTFKVGGTIVRCTATNEFGTATERFQVFVADLTAPVVTVPDTIITDNPVVTFTATATDNVDGDVPVTCTPASGSTFPQGTTFVSCSAVDSHLNGATGIFRVTVTGGPPALILPDTITEEATGPAGAVITYTATADDGSPVTCTPPSGSTFALGTTIVNCSATNGGGTAHGNFKVTVADTTPPTISVPAHVTAEATSPSGANVVYVATAFDVVDEDVPVHCGPASGALFPLGVTDVLCTASDERTPPNSDSTSFQVTVQDTTPPALTNVSATPSTLWPPDHKMVNIVVRATPVDAVDPSAKVKILSVSSNQPVNGTGDGDTAPDWNITGAMTLQLRAERSANKERVYTIVLQTRDANGNVATDNVLVRVTDTKQRSVRH